MVSADKIKNPPATDEIRKSMLAMYEKMSEEKKLEPLLIEARIVWLSNAVINVKDVELILEV